METAQQHNTSSWQHGDSPMVLSEIFSPSTSVAVWHRPEMTRVSRYFEQAFQALGLGIRGVYSMESLKETLHEALPDEDGKQDAIEDIHLLSDMLTCLFNCNTVGLRLAPLSSAMCPSFHVDNIQIRLVHTYLGAGTEWLPKEVLFEDTSSHNGLNKTKSGLLYNKQHIQQMRAYDVGLLKGKAWQDHEEMAAVHRSCQVQPGEKRVLLTLDPM